VFACCPETGWVNAQLSGLPRIRERLFIARLVYSSAVERRKLTRYQLWFPVQISSDVGGSFAITHNVGAGGLLLASPAQLEPGQRVKVSFALPPSGKAYEIEGNVVRLEVNPEDPEGTWPNRIAVQFDEVIEEIEPLLQQIAEKVA
jgi:hypothetical protein